MIGINIALCWWHIGCHCAHIRTVGEDQLANSEKLGFVDVAITIDIGLFENDQQFGRGVSPLITDSLEQVIEEPMELSGLHFVRVVHIVH